MLVGAFQVHERRDSPGRSSGREHRAVARARLEPDVEDVPLLAERRSRRTSGRPRPAAASSSTGRVNQASAPSLRKRSRKWRTVSAVRSWVPHVVQPRAGIGTPHDRWRLMHQSGRSETIASIRDWPQRGEPAAPSSIALSVRPAQVVVIDADEPLLGRPEDHRLLAPPAVRDSCATNGSSWNRWPDSSEHARRSSGLAAKTCLPTQPVGGLVGEPARRRRPG